jgi:hypothetical protein
MAGQQANLLQTSLKNVNTPNGLSEKLIDAAIDARVAVWIKRR